MESLTLYYANEVKSVVAVLFVVIVPVRCFLYDLVQCLSLYLAIIIDYIQYIIKHTLS